MSEFFERSWFIYGFRIKNFFIGIIIKQTDGTYGGVTFDWKKVQDAKNLIGFFHTHPAQMMQYSSTDDRAMRGFVMSEWKDLVCGIWNEERNKRMVYLFTREKEVKVMKCLWDKLFFIGKI